MPVHIPTCHHFKTNGVFCGSPALRGHRFCYFHHQWREDNAEAQPEREEGGPPLSAPPLGRQGGVVPPFELPLLEDANGVQVALQRVMQAILNDEIDNRKAGLLLYALQTASSNLKNTHFAHPALDRQAQAEYANADSPENDDPDTCDICAYDDEEEEDEENEEDQEGQDEEDDEEADESEKAEGAAKEEGEEEQQPAAQQPAPVTAAAPEAAGAAPQAAARVNGCSTAAPGYAPSAAAKPTARPAKLPPRTSPLPEHDEELDDKELIKMIRQLAGLT